VVTHDATYATVEDDDLVVRARDGDERALGELVARHHAATYRLALSVLDDPDVAADVAQDTFLRAFRGLDRFRGDAAFRTWLLAIAANEAKDALRVRKRRGETSLDAAPPLASPGADAEVRVVIRDEAERVRAMMQRLPEKQRLAVQLRVEEGLPFREVGRVIGSSEGAARVNYHHGIKKLREWMSVNG
jgi:RNA polymerase sigma-70 factor (ECF subfamily)